MPYKNKQDQAASAKKHYELNKQLIKDRAKSHNVKSRKRNRDFVKNYLSVHPCIDCGNDNIIVLEFDHVRGKKEHDISKMISLPTSLDALILEIAKCEIRCANCHRIVTHNRRLARS